VKRNSIIFLLQLVSMEIKISSKTKFPSRLVMENSLKSRNLKHLDMLTMHTKLAHLDEDF